MKRPLPKTPAQWLKEIKLAIADAADAEPFGPLVGTEITDANLFHLAPLVCLKFRGKKLKGREADRVIKVALANYIANTNPDGIDHGLEHHPMMAFTLCYVAAHLALDLVDEQEAEAILVYCEDHLV
jgi:hypothetical protein